MLPLSDRFYYSLMLLILCGVCMCVGEAHKCMVRTWRSEENLQGSVSSPTMDGTQGWNSDHQICSKTFASTFACLTGTQGTSALTAHSAPLPSLPTVHLCSHWPQTGVSNGIIALLSLGILFFTFLFFLSFIILFLFFFIFYFFSSSSFVFF